MKDALGSSLLETDTCSIFLWEQGPDFPQFGLLGKVRRTEVSCRQGGSPLSVPQMLVRHVGRTALPVWAGASEHPDLQRVWKFNGTGGQGPRSAPLWPLRSQPANSAERRFTVNGGGFHMKQNLSPASFIFKTFLRKMKHKNRRALQAKVAVTEFVWAPRSVDSVKAQMLLRSFSQLPCPAPRLPSWKLPSPSSPGAPLPSQAGATNILGPIMYNCRAWDIHGVADFMLVS